MFRLALMLALGAALASCSSEKANSSCPGGQVFVDGACRTVCGSDQDCKVAGEVCLNNACGPCVGCRRLPEVTEINGKGPPDGDAGHAANHLLNTLVLRGQDLDGVSVTLSGGAFTGELLTLCGTPSSTEVEVLLPDSVSKDTPYTLTVANQAGSCTVTATLLEGVQGDPGPPGTYTIGTGLNLNSSTLSVVFGQTSGTAAAGDHTHTPVPPNGSSAALAARNCRVLHADYPGLGNGVYWLDPEGRGDTFETYCDMITDGGGWTMVANIAPNDGNSVGYGNEDFWTKSMSYGTLGNRFSNDFKSPAAFRVMGDHLLIESAESGAVGAVLGWRRWPLLGAPRTFMSLFQPLGLPYAWASLHMLACDTGSADAVDVGTTNASDAIIRQGTCLKADFAVTGPSAWPDMARLTTTTGTTDNIMGGFAAFIDGYATWQPADPFMGLDHAGCGAASCAYSATCRVGADCRGNYCPSTYPTAMCGTVWNSRFFVR